MYLYFQRVEIRFAEIMFLYILQPFTRYNIDDLRTTTMQENTFKSPVEALRMCLLYYEIEKAIDTLIVQTKTYIVECLLSHSYVSQLKVCCTYVQCKDKSGFPCI